MKMRSVRAWVILAVLNGLLPIVVGAIELPPVLSSHMVLQRDRPVPIWGTGDANERITVEFASQKKETQADASGKWKLLLDPMSASAEPRTMLISGASGKKEIPDVLVGEVWLGSGQSNMSVAFSEEETPGEQSRDPMSWKLIKAGPYPQVRMISSGGVWLECSEETIRKYHGEKTQSISKLLFNFGLGVHKELQVPIGLLLGSVGGTPSGAWVNADAITNDPACKEALAQYCKTYDRDEVMKKYEQELAPWNEAVEAAKRQGQTYAVPKPGVPPKPGESFDVKRCLAPTGALYRKHIVPFIPYAIRGVLWDQGEHSTRIEGLPYQSLVMGALIRDWRKDWGQDFPFLYVQKPSGGGCALDLSDPVTCKGDEVVELPPPPHSPGMNLDPKSFIRILECPGTFMVISTDLGDGLHPENKFGYGTRAARVALGAVYGKPVEYYGPVYKSHKIEGDKVIVTFDHVGQGLTFKNGKDGKPGKLQGFGIAGANGRAVWADAVIDGDTVVLSSDRVKQPVTISYSCPYTSRWANFFNKDGLPALSFTTKK